MEGRTRAEGSLWVAGDVVEATGVGCDFTALTERHGAEQVQWQTLKM